MFDIEFNYSIREGGSIQLNLDETLERDEMELQAIQEIKQIYDDVLDIEITRIEKIG